ncbi:11283_t:CDS:2, partial [Cetraspora pellucida]
MINELAKNEETAEHEYHASLNKDVRKEKIIYSSYLLESQKFKHQINKEEKVTSTKRQKNLTNVLLEDDGKSNTTNIAYFKKSLCLSSSVSSSNINCEDVEPKYYNAKKRTKIIYSWKDIIDKIDFRNTLKKNM